MKAPWSPESICRDDHCPHALAHLLVTLFTPLAEQCWHLSAVSITLGSAHGHIPVHKCCSAAFSVAAHGSPRSDHVCRLFPASAVMCHDYSCMQILTQECMFLGYILWILLGSWFIVSKCTALPIFRPSRKGMPIYMSTSRAWGVFFPVLWPELVLWFKTLFTSSTEDKLSASDGISRHSFDSGDTKHWSAPHWLQCNLPNACAGLLPIFLWVCLSFKNVSLCEITINRL